MLPGSNYGGDGGIGSMLFVAADIGPNQQRIAVFVDTGASNTIISPSLASRVGLSVDRSQQGMAVGLGVGHVEGMANGVDVTLLGRGLPGDPQRVRVKLSLSGVPVMGLPTQGIDMILGLNTLRQHRVTIDLDKNCLFFDGGRVIPIISPRVVNSNLFASEARTIGFPTTGGKRLGSASSPAASSRLLSTASPAPDAPNETDRDKEMRAARERQLQYAKKCADDARELKQQKDEREARERALAREELEPNPSAAATVKGLGATFTPIPREPAPVHVQSPPPTKLLEEKIDPALKELLISQVMDVAQVQRPHAEKALEASGWSVPSAVVMLIE